MKIAIVLPSSRSKRGDYVEPDGNQATDEEWSLEIKLGEQASGRPQSIKWLNLIDSERAEETEKRKKRERTFACLLLHRERRAPQCTEKQFRLPQFRQNESAPSLTLLLRAGLDGSGYGMAEGQEWKYDGSTLCPMSQRGILHVSCTCNRKYSQIQPHDG